MDHGLENLSCELAKTEFRHQLFLKYLIARNCHKNPKDIIQYLKLPKKDTSPDSYYLLD